MFYFIYNIFTNMFRPVILPSSGLYFRHKSTVAVISVTITP